MVNQISLFNENIHSNNNICTENLNLKKKLTVLSLFSGCGGMDLGFKGGFDVLGNSYEKNPYDIIFSNDISKKACDTYSYNFGHEPLVGDITEIANESLHRADIVIGGFPCQDFSLAGKRKGLSTERGRLYLEMKRVIENVKPIAFVAENVDGIRKNKTNEVNSPLEVILEDFKEIGYNVVYKVINASHYGVPQNRIRVIIVGIREDIDKKMKYPVSTHGELGKNDVVSSKMAIDDLWGRIDCSQIKNHSNKDFSKAKFYPNKKMQGNRQIIANEPAPTIRAEHHGNIEGHYRSLNEDDPQNMQYWRRLSVRECARLQTFPDDFIFNCSATDAYRQIGNAVPPVLSWHIARALYKSLFN